MGLRLWVLKGYRLGVRGYRIRNNAGRIQNLLAFFVYMMKIYKKY